MNKTFTLLALAILLFGASSCKNTTTNQQNEAKVSHDGTDDLTLKLNSGKRWEANASTTEGIQKMVLMVDSFQETDSATAYLQLKTDLENVFTSIFKQCTMTGPAHDQLHNYLFPLKRLFNRLKSEDTVERSKAVLELKEYLKEYSIYFE